MSSGDACPAGLERTKGVQDVSVLWDAASHWPGQTGVALRKLNEFLYLQEWLKGVFKDFWQTACPAWTSLPMA